MHINKYILGLSTVVIVGSLGFLSVEALSINNSSFAKGLPTFKSIFFRSQGKDTINGATNPEGVRIDNGGIYATPAALPGNNSTVLKLNGASSQIFIDPVANDNFTNDSITSVKITDNSIINSNFADISIGNTHISNNTIVKTKFDPGITRPSGGTMFITNNVCAGMTAITSVNAGTASCATLPSGGAAGMPTCSEGQQPVYSGGAWTCEVLLLGGGIGDPYWTGSTGYWIANINPGNVGIGLNNPASKLAVSGGFEVLGESEEQVYCYATDTWVPLSTYDANSCIGCSPGYSYNPSTLLCEQNSCVGSGGAVDGVCGFANGRSYTSAPWKFLCATGNATAVAGSGPWTWSCNGFNGGTNDNCTAYLSGGGGGGASGSNIYIINLGAFSSQINDVNAGGASFYVISQGSFPINAGQQVEGVHAGLGSNRMDYDVSSSTSRCIYTFINNPGAANSCNPGGYDQQTQGSAGMQYGTIWASAYSSSDRVDLLMCSGICN